MLLSANKPSRQLSAEAGQLHFQKGLTLAAQQRPSSERDVLELSIRESFHAARIGLRGWATPEVGLNAAAILELAKRQSKPQSVLLGLWGIWTNTLNQGRVAESLEQAKRMLADGKQIRDSDLLVLGHRAAMSSYFCLGHSARRARAGGAGFDAV